LGDFSERLAKTVADLGFGLSVLESSMGPLISVV